MTAKQPPAIAAWMLRHFGSGPNNEALLGDLAEQYRQNENAMWYWRQSMKAIPVSFFKEIRGHKATAARALLLGWGLWTLYIMWVIPRLTPYFLGTTGEPSVGVAFVPSDPIGSTWTILTAPVGFHFAVERPFSFVFAFALPLIVWALCGLLVARFHREQRTSVVLLFAGSILLMNLLLNALFHYVPEISLGLLVGNAATSFLGILLGGGLFRFSSLGTR
jgi:hypothetical protein